MDIFSDEVENNLALTQGALSATQEAAQIAKDSKGNDEVEFLPRQTGIKYFDEKIQNNAVTPYDAYLAQKFLKLDITMNANINMNAKMKTLSGTKVYDDVQATLAGLELGDQAINAAGDKAGGIIFKHDNAGFFGGANRKLNELSGGIWGLSDEASSFSAKNNNLVYSIARAQTRGKTTNEAIRDAKSTYDASFRSPDEYRSRINQGQEIQLNYLKEQLEDLQARGYQPTQHMIEQYHKFRQKVDYLKSGKKFDKQTYNTIGVVAREWLNQSKE